MKDLLTSAQELQEELVRYRRYLHEHPEVGMDLPDTSAYVKEELIKMGYTPHRCGGDGIIAVAGDANAGPVFLIRGDMDALPVAEEAEVPGRSSNGNMHACGHDLHTAMLLGAAKLLKEREHELQGAVKLMFQPGEELLAGAKAMIDDQLLIEPSVDAAAMIHVFTGIPVDIGKFLLPDPGPTSAASDRFLITLQGKGTHGAMPEQGVDPLNVMSHLHLSLQALNSREIAPAESFVLTVGRMSGGTAANVIPDTAEIEGTIRTFDDETRNFIHKRVEEISVGIASSFRATADVRITKGCPSLISDDRVLTGVRHALSDAFGEQNLLSMKEVFPGGRMMGSEDFSFVSRRVPSVMVALVAGDAREGQPFPMHHPKALFDESVLWKGAAAYVLMALDYLEKAK